jgi:hypothetical protein
MGSSVHLALGGFEVDWGKNTFFNNHGSLFQPNDVTLVPYHYVGDDGVHFTEMREGAARPLGSVVQRLELLGYTLETARRNFDQAMDRCSDEPIITFDDLLEVLIQLDVEQATIKYHKNYDFGKFFSDEIFDRLGLGRYVKDDFAARYALERYPSLLNREGFPTSC